MPAIHPCGARHYSPDVACELNYGHRGDHRGRDGISTTGYSWRDADTPGELDEALDLLALVATSLGSNHETVGIRRSVFEPNGRRLLYGAIWYDVFEVPVWISAPFETLDELVVALREEVAARDRRTAEEVERNVD